MLKAGLVLLPNHWVDKQVFFNESSWWIFSDYESLPIRPSCDAVVWRRWWEKSGSNVDGLKRSVEDLDVISGNWWAWPWLHRWTGGKGIAIILVQKWQLAAAEMSRSKLIKNESGFMVVWTAFSEPQDKRIHKTTVVCFDVSLSLYINTLMWLEGTGLGFGGFPFQVPVADQRTGK